MHNTYQSQTNSKTNVPGCSNPDLGVKQNGVKAILIDPVAMTVTEVMYGGELHEIYQLIDARPFTVAPIGDSGDGIYVDDDGLFRGGQSFFKFEGYPQPLAGKGLILGVDDEGESVAPAISLDKVRASVRWVFPFTTELWIDRASGVCLSLDELCC